jgi:hypothetical protein
VQRESITFKLAGVDGAEPRLVARTELVQIFAGMCQSDLLMAHSALLDVLSEPVDPTIVFLPVANDHYTSMEAGDLLHLLEVHTRAVNALQGLLALREPDELVEAHIR